MISRYPKLQEQWHKSYFYIDQDILSCKDIEEFECLKIINVLRATMSKLFTRKVCSSSESQPLLALTSKGILNSTDCSQSSSSEWGFHFWNGSKVIWHWVCWRRKEAVLGFKPVSNRVKSQGHKMSFPVWLTKVSLQTDLPSNIAKWIYTLLIWISTLDF